MALHVNKTFPDLEKLPIDEKDYGGLQVDNRGKGDRQHEPVPPYRLDEKRPYNVEEHGLNEAPDHAILEAPQDSETSRSPVESNRSPLDPLSPSSTFRTPVNTYRANTTIDALGSSNIFGQPWKNEEYVPLPAEKERTLYGVRRKTFWIIIGVALAIIVVAASIGGAIGGTRKDLNSTSSNVVPSQSSNSPPSSTSSPASATTTPSMPVNHPYSLSDVAPGSPLEFLSFSNSANAKLTPVNQQSLRLYYQSVSMNVKEMMYDGELSSWKAANPILTDAINNTGLAAISYINGSDQQGSLFYIGVNGLIQEKRKRNSDPTWSYIGINTHNLPAVGNISPSSESTDKSSPNKWDSYRMAAVHSLDFSTGPGCRLFYHARGSSGPIVQEMIWIQENDTWFPGATLADPWPTSQLAAVIDPNTHLLRLFYSAGNLTLQESYIDITKPGATYTTGLRIGKFLAADDSSFAAVVLNGTTLLYHYNATSKSIVEFDVPPPSSNTPTTVADSQTTVMSPQGNSSTGTALYHPIGAAITDTYGLPTSVYVIWADTKDDQETGYERLMVTNREGGGNKWVPVVELPLGKSNMPQYVP